MKNNDTMRNLCVEKRIFPKDGVCFYCKSKAEYLVRNKDLPAEISYNNKKCTDCFFKEGCTQKEKNYISDALKRFKENDAKWKPESLLKFRI